MKDLDYTRLAEENYQTDEQIKAQKWYNSLKDKTEIHNYFRSNKLEIQQITYFYYHFIHIAE